jgi:transcriptional regulator with XRE-family HTH domain
MKRLGEFLRGERQARGISLQQIAADTRISMTMLQAIENGDGEQLPAPVLIKGFLRSYAQRIGLDPEDVIAEYQDLIEEVGARHEAIDKFHQRLHPKSSKKKSFALLIALSLLAGLALFWTHVDFVHRQPETPTEVKSSLSGEVGQKATIADSASEPSEKQPFEEATKTAEEIDTEAGAKIFQPGVRKAPAELLPGPFVLRVEALERTWLRIIIDGSREREYLLQPGEQLTWMARSDLELLVGNAGGIRLFLNDNPLKLLGQSGEVVRLKLPDPSLIFENVLEGTDAGNRQ